MGFFKAIAKVLKPVARVAAGVATAGASELLRSKPFGVVNNPIKPLRRYGDVLSPLSNIVGAFTPGLPAGVQQVGNPNDLNNPRTLIVTGSGMELADQLRGKVNPDDISVYGDPRGQAIKDRLKAADAALSAAEEAEERRRRAAAIPTVLTTPLGVTGNAGVQRRSLLGQ